MKAIMIMFDSLNRRMLPPYGCDWTIAPNFKRLAEKTVTFNNSYIGSMACMPARREIHTGRYNFLHKSWGPIEPFDDSMPEILNDNGVYSHLVSDHYHYWEDGGSTYHSRYSSWEFSRGQEGDPWKGKVGEVNFDSLNNTRNGSQADPMIRQDWVNREHIVDEEEFCQAKTFKMGTDFIDANHNQDNWFLQIETFDPHEPYYSPQKYKDLYPHDYDQPHYDWPSYHPGGVPDECAEHVKYEYCALLSMCDNYLGKVIDTMDRYNMWEDTMLIVNTDHGFFLGEQGHWAKCFMPMYNEVANTPFFIWDPRCAIKGESRQALVQTIDIAPTVLDYFGIDIPKDMQGIPLKDTIKNDTKVRDAALYGLFGAHINVTDRIYTYMRAAVNRENTPLYDYTIMPTRHGWGRAFIDIDRLQKATFVEPFNFMKGCPVMKIPSKGKSELYEFGSLLFDMEKDPKQEHPINDKEIENMMIDKMIKLMEDNDCPKEQFTRLGLGK